MISAGDYPFLAISDLTCCLEDTRLGFSVFSVPPDSKKTKLESSHQETSPSESKNSGVVLAPSPPMEVHPYSYFLWCGYF